MGTSKTLTENDERLIAKDIVNMLTQKGVSFSSACDILEDAENMLRYIPLVSIKEES